MKEIKTAEEVPNFLYEDSNGIIRLGYHGDTNITDEWIEWKNKFADQFKPKWIPVEPVHEIEPGHYVVYGSWFGNRGITTVFIKEITSSDRLSSNATDYMKIELPTNDIDG